MGNQIPAETVELIRKARELGLPAKSGAALAGVNINTVKKWGKQFAGHPVKHYGRLPWTEEGIAEQLRRIRAIEGISGVWAGNVDRNHKGVYEATWNFNGYPHEFKNAFGFPFSKAAKYLAKRIRELHESGKEINPALLSKERRIFRQVIEQGHFGAVLRFVTEEPVVRKRTEREIYEALARVILRYLPGPDSFITADTRHVFPPQYGEEAAALLAYGTQIGLLVPALINGTKVYRAPANAIPRIRETIGYSRGEDISSIDWWNSLLEAESPEGDALRDIERGLDGLSDIDRILVQRYLMQALCNPHTYDPEKCAYNPKISDYRRASSIADYVNGCAANGRLSPEAYATLLGEHAAEMTPAKARDIIKSFLIRRRSVEYEHDALAGLVPGLKPRQFDTLMTKIKNSPGFTGDYGTVVYIGSAPPTLRTAPRLSEIYMKILGGATVSELQKEYGDSIYDRLYDLRQKGAIKSNGRGKPEAVPADQIPAVAKNRAAHGAVTSAIAEYAAEHPYQWVSKSDFFDAMAEKGFKNRSVTAILLRRVKAGDLALEETEEQYRFAGRDGQAEPTATSYSGRVSSIGDVFAECPELGPRVGSSPYNRDIISARNGLPPDKVRLFYDALLKIPSDDAKQGARLEDFLPFAGTPNSYGFMEWVVRQPRLSGQQFDRELNTYTRIGPRYG